MTETRGSREAARARALRLYARPAAVALAVTALGAAVRLAFLGAKPLWYDEAYTAWMASAPDLATLLSRLATADSHPPLFYLLARGSAALLGPTETALRLPSLLAGIAAVPLVLRLGARTGARAAGRFAAAALALLPAVIHLSIEARSYALLLLLSVGIQLAYLSYLERRRGALAAFSALAVLALWTHVGAIFLVGAVHLHELLGETDRTRRRRWLLAAALQALAFSPWLLAIFNQLDRWPWIAGVARYFQVDVFLGRYSPLVAFPGAAARAAGMVLFGVLVLAATVVAVRARGAGEEARRGRPHAAAGGDRPSAERFGALRDASGGAADRSGDTPTPRALRPTILAALPGAALLAAGLPFAARPFDPAAPLLAPRVLGRGAALLGLALLALALLPALLDRARRRPWLARLFRAPSALDVPTALLLLTLLVGSGVAAFRPALGYKPLVVVVPGLLLFLGRHLGATRYGRASLGAFLLLAAAAVPLQGRYHLRADYRGVGRLLAIDPGDVPAFVYPGHHRRLLGFYAPQVPLQLLASTGPAEGRLPGLAPGARAWLVASSADGGRADTARRWEARFTRAARVVARHHLRGVDVLLLEGRAPANPASGPPESAPAALQRPR